MSEQKTRCLLLYDWCCLTYTKLESILFWFHCRVIRQQKFLSKYKIAFILCQGGTAVDAVEAAVRSLEDDPTFDAGHGSVLTEELTVEVDAMIMDGNTLDSGTSGKNALCYFFLP